MSRKRFKAEEIVNKLREADVAIAQGRTVAVACKQIGVTENRPTIAGAKSTADSRPIRQRSSRNWSVKTLG